MEQLTKKTKYTMISFIVITQCFLIGGLMVQQQQIENLTEAVKANVETIEYFILKGN
jgi:hypothetical protein